MKRFLQKSLFRLHSLLLLLVMSVVGVSAAWADEMLHFDGTNNGGHYPESHVTVDVPYYYVYDSGKFVVRVDVGYAVTRVVFKDVRPYSSDYTTELTCTAGSFPNGNTGNQITWEAGDEIVNDVTFGTTPYNYMYVYGGIDVYYKELVYDEPVNYTVNITDAPEGATVSLDGTDCVDGTIVPSTKFYSENSITVDCPAGYYADVTYSSLTFDVVFHHYYVYNFVIDGTDEGRIRYLDNWNEYRNGQSLEVKSPLEVSAFEAYDVNGYDEGDVTFEAVDAYTTNVKLTYTESAIISYSVTITGMPTGASVKIEDAVYEENGNFTHESRKVLRSYDAQVQNCPETHYYDDNYNSETKAFTFSFNQKFAYSVVVADASAYQGAEAGIKRKYGATYLVGATIYERYELSADEFDAAEVDGYTGTFTLMDKVFTVSYTKNDFVVFKATDYSEGNQDVTKEGVNLKAYKSSGTWGDNHRFMIYDQSCVKISSVDAPIVKVELEYKWALDNNRMYSNVGNLSADGSEWTGSTKYVEIKDSYDYGAECTSIKVYLAQPVEYHVNITGMPADNANCYVELGTTQYTENGSYDYNSYDELYETSLHLYYPESYKATRSFDAEGKTYTVTYTALTQYSVVADADNAYTGTGAGLKVTVGVDDYRWPTFDDTFYFDGTLEGSAIEVREVDGYTGSFVLDNDADPKTITVKYVENTPETYTVEFTGVVPEGASVTITDAAGDHIVNYAGIDKTFQSKYTITEASAKAKAFEFYDATVALDGTTFTVNYSKVDYIYVDLTNSEGRNLIRQSSEGTVAVNYNAYKGCANLYAGDPITVTSNTYNIKRIEYVRDESYSDEKTNETVFNWGAWATDNEYKVWEANGYKTKSVVLSTTYSDICYTAVKVYLDTDPVGQFAMSAAGWATLFSDAEYALPDGYTAYTAGKLVEGQPTLVEDGKIVLTEIDRVPANTAVLISGPENDHVELLATYGAVAPEVNYLQGTLNEDTFYANNYSMMGPGHFDNDQMEWIYGSFGPCQLYQLAKENDLVGFYRQVENGVSLQCAANKAFLVVPNAAVSSSNARFVLPGQEEGALTGIDAIATEGAEAIYNLQGQRVNATKAGVYVKNGRKVIVK